MSSPLTAEQSTEDLVEWEYNEKRLLKADLEEDHLAFNRYFLKKRTADKFIISPHHCLMAETIERTFTGEITRLIINVPPGYTKTEMAVINYIARGLAINPSAKFIHLAYADKLANTNSSAIREVVESSEYQDLWPMKLKRDSNAKGEWYNKEGGGMLAASAGGQVTGFRAGRMDKKKFTGAIVIDDPIKPDDAYSEIVRETVNNRFNNTFKSRVAHEQVPIIVIMQRIHEDDPTGFLLKGGTGEMWHHLCLPVEIHPEEEREEYDQAYTHGIPIEYDLPCGPLWAFKKTQDDIDTMRTADPYTCASQYDQSPTPIGGGLFKPEWWNYYKLGSIIPEYRFITADTAQKTKEKNDYTVFQLWGYLEGHIYLLDQERGKMEAPELRRTGKAFWMKHLHAGGATFSQLREMRIEDKSSGTGLIQDLRESTDPPIPITPIQRNIDKVTRAMDMVPYIASGRVHLPEDAPFLLDLEEELRKFTAAMTHSHDDQIDPLLDAIDHALRPDENIAQSW